MIGNPPTSSELPVSQGMARWSAPWVQWVTQVFLALSGWKRTYHARLTHDFGSVSSQSQATQTVTVTGARIGDAVMVRPTTAVNGVIVDGTVTASDTVTVRVSNFSAGAIDPASQVYQVIVWQQ
jgi:hypothetical protein